MAYLWFSFHSLDYATHHWKIQSNNLCFTDGDKKPLSKTTISAFLPQINCAQVLTPAELVLALVVKIQMHIHKI